MSKPFAIVGEMGIGDFVNSTVFISMIKDKYPDAVFDAGVRDEMISTLERWGIFRDVLPFEAVWDKARRGKYEIAFSGRHSHALGIERSGSWLVPNRMDGEIPLLPVYKSNRRFLERKGFRKKKGIPFWIVDKEARVKAKKLVSDLKHPRIAVHNSKGDEFWFRRKWPNKRFEKLVRQVDGSWLQLGSKSRDWENHTPRMTSLTPKHSIFGYTRIPIRI